ncbi:hypothetical protein ACFVYD_34530 [Streptomyces sp. NPDC058301]|uniref:hypothetical protein n=1 Tax=Streptomyces sp. NPDC058301 TaxID=3346436 RepID=UPI0036E65B28
MAPPLGDGLAGDAQGVGDLVELRPMPQGEQRILLGQKVDVPGEMLEDPEPGQSGGLRAPEVMNDCC